MEFSEAISPLIKRGKNTVSGTIHILGLVSGFVFDLLVDTKEEPMKTPPKTSDSIQLIGF